MKHIARFSVKENFFKPYAVNCSCGVAGEFASQDDARLWMQTKHFDNLKGISTYEFEEVELPEVKAPVRPAENDRIFAQPKQSNPTVPAKATNGKKPMKKVVESESEESEA